ncbi:MAG TPA: S9 family peptidase [Thermoanaerobaculia bacterium]|jgi:dipeptidyl aminopeptidase/acylaminoacyl peptidase
MFLLAVLMATLSIEDYVTLTHISSPKLTPDGKRIAYVVNRADMERSAYDAEIWLAEADGSRNLQLTSAPGNDNTPRWSPDGKRLAFLSEREGRAQIFVINPDGGEAAKLTSEPTAIRTFDWSPDGKSIAFLRMEGPSPEEEKRIKEREDVRIADVDDKHVHLYVADVATRAVRRLTRGAFSIYGFDWSPDGKTIAFDRAPVGGLDGMYRTDLYLLSVEDGTQTPLLARGGLDRGPRFSPDGKELAFVSTSGIDDWLAEQHVNVLRLDGGAAPAVVSRAYGRTPESLLHWTPEGIFFEGPWNTTTQLYRINGTNVTDLTKFEGLSADPDVANGRVVFVRQSLTSPPELYVTDLATFAPRRITNHNERFRDRQLGATRVIRWKNPKDGLEIEGLLTLPVGYREGTRVPLLVFVHGGPASRFDQGYLGYLGPTYAPHALAANGFAILRPNVRGTGGYGEAFKQANRQDWGGMDWLDVNAGIDKVIADGIADPDRLGLMGWSYGGYLATWSLSQSKRFKAVSIGAPVVDLISFHGTSDIRDFIPTYFPKMPLPLLQERSPLLRLTEVNVPVLIQHGADDDRVPLSQGTMLYRRLDELGADVTFVTYPRSAHGVREPKLRIDVARRNLEFFTKHVRDR